MKPRKKVKVRIINKDLNSTKDPYSSMIMPATGQRTNRRNRPMKKGRDPCRTIITLSLQWMSLGEINSIWNRNDIVSIS